jgi:hypothetical protein
MTGRASRSGAVAVASCPAHPHRLLPLPEHPQTVVLCPDCGQAQRQAAYRYQREKWGALCGWPTARPFRAQPLSHAIDQIADLHHADMIAG